jgi:hypothetical protein
LRCDGMRASCLQHEMVMTTTTLMMIVAATAREIANLI